MTLENLYTKITENIKNNRVKLIPDVLNTGCIADFYASLHDPFCIDDARVMMSEDRKEVTLTGISGNLGIGNMKIEMVFTFQNDNLQSELTALLSGGSWQLENIGWFALADPGIGIHAGDDSREIEGILSGIVHIGTDIKLSMRYPLTDNQWLLRGAFPVDQPSVAYFTQLVGGINLVTVLPPPFSTFADLSVQSIDIVYDYAVKKNIDYILLKVGTHPENEWQILPGLRIPGLNFACTVRDPGSSLRGVEYEISGYFSIGAPNANKLLMKASVPDYKAVAELQEGSIQLGDLFTMFWSDATLDLKSEISCFNLEILPATQKYFLNCGLISDWTFLSLSYPALDFTMREVTLKITGLQGSVSGEFAGLFHIGDDALPGNKGVDLRLAAGYGDKTWTFSGSTGKDQKISLSDIVATFLAPFGITEIPDWVSSEHCALEISNVSFQAVLPDKSTAKADSYKVGGDVYWMLDYCGFNLALDATVDITYSQKAISGKITGTTKLLGLIFVIGYQFGDDKENITLEWEGIKAKYEKPVFKVELKDISLGKIVTKFMDAFIPDFKLSAPWNLLDSIDLSGLSFEYTRDATDRKKDKIEIICKKEFDLGFLEIEEIKLTKDEEGVFLGFKGKFFGTEISDKDESTSALAGKGSKVQDMPDVPGGDLFDLEFLGMGQHVRLGGSSSFHSVDSAVQVMEKAFSDPNSNPNTIPIKDGAGSLVFDQNSNWLIGADFTVAQFYRMAFVFNDPDLYGLVIKVADNAKYMKNLQFEILYKKVNDTIGVYQMELQLPDEFRHLEFGEVSVTLPNIGIQVYTNGNFRLDVGWPASIKDFSRSFTMQIFPFTGAGGFYFASLTGATASGLPVVTKGIFNPVIEAGIALSLGVGKDINAGILKAGLSLTAIAMLQGTYAVFTLSSNKSSSSGETDVYYRFSGTLALVGRIYGEVNFAIISASFEVVAYAMVNMVIEAYKAIPIYMEAGVSVILSVKINLGLFKIHIDLSFSATISVSFVIGSDTSSDALWYEADNYSGALSNASVLSLKSAEPLCLKWQPVKFDREKESYELNIYFIPHLTVSDEMTVPGKEKWQSPQYVGMLYIDNGSGATENPAYCGMNALVRGCLYWALSAVLGSTRKEVELNWLNEQDITDEKLNDLLKYMETCPDNMAPFNYKNKDGNDIRSFLKEFFTIRVIAVDAEKEAEISASVFPVLPDLQMERKLNNEEEKRIDFSGYSMTGSGGYIGKVTKLLKLLRVSCENTDEAKYNKRKGRLESVVNIGYEEQTNLSMATFVFTDFIALIIKQSLQDARDYLSSQGLASAKVSDLVRGTVSCEQVQKVSGMASRFMLHGLRLPEPPSVETGKIRPLYELTGQQWEIPGLGEKDTYTISLMTGESWITFKDAVDGKLKITIDGDSKQRNSNLRSNILQPSLQEGGAKQIKNVNVLPQQFSLGGNTDWDYPGDFFSMNSAKVVLWKTPLNFRTAIQDTGDKIHGVSLKTITTTGQSTTQGDIKYCKWATSLSVTIQKITAQDILDTPLAGNIYNLTGADDAGIRIMEDLLIYMQGNTPAFEQVYFLMEQDPVSGKEGFLSLGNGELKAAIIKANLSTETNPDTNGLRRISLNGTDKNTLNEPGDFVTLLWECSVVRSGGFYFYYNTEESGKGLPDYLFGEAGTATVQIVITYDSDVPRSFMNAVITGDDLDFSKTAVYAESEDITVAVPVLMPGHVGYELCRNNPGEFNPSQNPPTVLEDQVYLQNQFNLLGVSLPDVKVFRNYMPAGPSDSMSQEDIQNFRSGKNSVADPLAPWKYSSVIPYYKLVREAGDFPDFPNPYAGIGKRIVMELNWQDMFGNALINTVQPMRVGMDLLYTDSILAVSRWPSVACSYLFGTVGNEINLFVDFCFEASRYNDGTEAAGKNAAIDLTTFMTLYYQLHSDDIQMKMSSTIQGTDTVPEGFEQIIRIPELSEGFIEPIICYLTAIAEKQDHPLIPAPYTVSVPVDKNKIADYADTIPLIVSIHMNRVKNVAPDFKDTPGVAGCTTPVKPRLQSGSVAGNRNETLGITYFAGKFEEAFKNLADGNVFIKIATSSEQEENSEVTHGSSPVWMVRFDRSGKKGINYTYDRSEAYFFSPIPLSTSLISLNADIKMYQTGVPYPSGEVMRKNFTSVDLDVWGKLFLEAVDSFLAPALAVPVFLLDKNGRTLQEILKIKKDIAEAIEGTIDYIIDKDDKSGANIGNAQEKWKQEILKELSAAYKYSAVVQTPVTVNSLWKGSNEDPATGVSTTPKFYGKMMTKGQAAAGNDESQTLGEYNLSTSKLPLGNGNSWLTYMFECKDAAEFRNFRFSDMLYKVTHLEQQIKMMGIDQYTASTWLTFVIPLEESYSQVGDIVVPVPLRAYPVPPSVTGQRAGYPAVGKIMTLSDARLWDFIFTYKNALAAQDTVQVQIALNIPEEGYANFLRRKGEQLTLDKALAQFIESYPQIEADFRSYLMGLTPRDVKEESTLYTNAKNAVDAFKNITRQVATAWGSWNQVNPRHGHKRTSVYQSATQQPIVLDFTVIETENEEKLNVQVIADGANQLGMMPKINITGYDARCIGDNTYEYIHRETKKPLAYRERNINPLREVVLEKLDIMNIQNAWGGVQLVRNQQLLPDGAGGWQKTNERFLYQTSWVKYYTKLITSLSHHTAIDIASVGTERYPASPGRSLEDNLLALFDALTRGGGMDRLNMKLSVDYVYFIPETVLPVTVPVLLTLPLYVDPEERGKSFAVSLARKLGSWKIENSLPDGVFHFKLDVFSSFDSNTLVLQLLLTLESMAEIK